MEDLGLTVASAAGSAAHWAGRRVLVTGATGLVGSWLARELLRYGAHVVALVRDANPQSELFRSGDISRLTVVSGAVEDFWAVQEQIHRGLWGLPPLRHIFDRRFTPMPWYAEWAKLAAEQARTAQPQQ